ncbi:MAG TPA: hypothetical protein VEZ44_03055, partial [bacterium]|nr:hypothetical protein [bacterium]
MTPDQAVAIAVALCYGLAVAAVVGRGHLRKPWFFVAFVVGAIVFWVAALLVDPIQALVAYLFGWDIGAYSTSIGVGLVGALIAATINEIFKLAVTLPTLSRGGEEADAAAFGAAVGAGFGAVGAFQVMGLALVARTLHMGAPDNLVTPLVQQFGFVAANGASTALAAYGATHGRLGAYLGAAVLYQTVYSVLGLLFALEVYTLPVWTMLVVA